MDDTQQLKAEFPLGDLKIVVSEPTPSQLFALGLSRKSSDADQAHLVRRLCRVLEALTGPDQWYDVIEDGLISGEISPTQLIEMASAVLEFPWADYRKPVATPIDVVGTPAAPDAGPRIIPGG